MTVNAAGAEFLTLKPLHPWQESQLQLNFQHNTFAYSSARLSLSDDPGYQSKSKGKAMLLSLLIPGAGQRYLGHHTFAKVYFITEVALWASVISFEAYSGWRRDDMKAYAALNAGANVDGKDSQYFVDMGNYINIHEYNDAKQRMREFSKIYDEDDFYWAWDNRLQQHDFEQLRISSDRARNRAVFAIGGIFANHLISAIDAVWKSYRLNKRQPSHAHNYNLQFSSYRQGEWRVVLNTSF